jgi:hypothetical protein
MKRLGILALHLGATAALGLLVPACGGKNDSGSSGTANSVSAPPLFAEEFSGAFPGTAWSPPGEGGTVQIDASTGDKAPSLMMTTTTRPAFVATSTTMTFASRPMTLAVQMSASGAGDGSGGIGVFNAQGSPVAAAEWHPASPSALTFSIQGTTNPTPVAAPLVNSGFHTFTFSVDPSGGATWSIDGTMVMTKPGFPDGQVRVELYDVVPAGGGAAFATFHFDNVTVSSP